jgi:hypothetical protein
MASLDYVALGMLGFMAALAIGVVLFLAGWPGRVAASRNHPYRTGVTIGGWVTLIGGGIFYPLVLIWAYSGTPDADLQNLPKEDAE